MTLDEIQVSLNTLKTQLKNNLQNRGVSIQDTDGLITLSNKILNISNTIPVTITLTSDATTLDSSNNFTAHLEAKVLDYGNNPVQNVTIQFLKDSSLLGESLTNSSGIATYDYVGSTGGTFNLTAQLNSVSVYNGSVSNAVSITVILSPDLTSYLSSGAYFTNLWNDGSGGTPSYSEGILTGNARCFSTLINGFSDKTKYKLTFDYNISDGNRGGFAFGYNASTNNFAQIIVDVGSTIIEDRTPNVNSKIYDYNTNLLTSGWHSIILNRNGNDYSISIDGTSSSTLTISGLANNVGLLKWGGGSSSLKNLKLY